MKSVSESLKTVLTISMSLLIIHFVWGGNWPIVASLITGMTGVIFPKVALTIDYVWKALTGFIGTVVQRVVLVIIFYLFLVPIAFIARIFNKSKFLQLSKNSTSTFVTENRTFDKNSFEKPW